MDFLVTGPMFFPLPWLASLFEDITVRQSSFRGNRDQKKKKMSFKWKQKTE